MSIQKDGLTIAIAIATAGRRDILTQTVVFLNNQQRRPDEFLICPASPEDIDPEGLSAYDGAIMILPGSAGLSYQRNLLLSAATADIVVFFDDDFLPAADYLGEVEKLFASDPTIVIATGHVIADGIGGPGFEFEEGRALLAADVPGGAPSIEPTFNGYGCNMAIRMAPVRDRAVRFDENLPFYSWLEDIDFSRQLATSGRIVRADRMRGVHLGTKKAGRSPGRRLGYSQVANRVYIHRKGNMPLHHALGGILRNVTSNLARSLKPEPWTDRRGRLQGNMLALRDLLTGRIDPRNILDM
ncbi:glycosyltransferase family 2 protein [Shinella zoogloeoides]|uniref:glycosyltransferase family 2 protein n=1 Tax=Shinella zoogloeoides TaxID=352475 RepID=UPI001F576032|nr:glycosyltransferase family 2 protein [Shinella zoogloeoides]